MTTFQTGHVGLNVTDLARSKAFYQAVFGFNVVSEATEGEHEFALLAEGDKMLLTLWVQSNGRFNTQNPGLHHLAFEVDSIEDVQLAEEKVRQAGVKLYHDGIVPHREGASSGGIFFEDPDGIRLEIFTKQGADINPAPTGDAPTCGFF